jgi:hypothetical protein
VFLVDNVCRAVHLVVYDSAPYAERCSSRSATGDSSHVGGASAFVSVAIPLSRARRWCMSSLLDWSMMDVLNMLDVLDVLRSRILSSGWSRPHCLSRPGTSAICLLLWSPHLCHLHSLARRRLPTDYRTTGNWSRCGDLLVARWPLGRVLSRTTGWGTLGTSNWTSSTCSLLGWLAGNY